MFKFVVVLPVLKLFLDSLADDNAPILRVNRDVPLIEQLVKVGSEQKAVRDLVPHNERVWLDVSSFEDGQRALPGDRTLSGIGFLNHHPKQPLTEPRMNELRLSKPV